MEADFDPAWETESDLRDHRQTEVGLGRAEAELDRQMGLGRAHPDPEGQTGLEAEAPQAEWPGHPGGARTHFWADLCPHCEDGAAVCRSLGRCSVATWRGTP